MRDDLFRAFSAWIFFGALILGRCPKLLHCVPLALLGALTCQRFESGDKSPHSKTPFLSTTPRGLPARGPRLAGLLPLTEY